MSLNRTLDRLFAEVRKEAKRNPAFADRLEAAILAHQSARTVAPESVADAKAAIVEPTPVVEEAAPGPALPNPHTLFQREGEEALRTLLEDPAISLDALRSYVREHNLDPAGAQAEADKEGLVIQVLAQAKRRAERDKKLFDY